MRTIPISEARLVARPVPDYPGYMASVDGRLFSLPRTAPDGRRVRGGELKPTLCPDGRYKVWLGSKTAVAGSAPRRLFKFHRIILRAFRGECPPGLEACHNDGDAGNNWLGNLRWDTHVSNCVDRSVHGAQVRGEQCHNAKLTEAKVREIRRRWPEFKSYAAAARAFGVSWASIRNIVNRRSWKHVA